MSRETRRSWTQAPPRTLGPGFSISRCGNVRVDLRLIILTGHQKKHKAMSLSQRICWVVLDNLVLPQTKLEKIYNKLYIAKLYISKTIIKFWPSSTGHPLRPDAFQIVGPKGLGLPMPLCKILSWIVLAGGGRCPDRPPAPCRRAPINSTFSNHTFLRLRIGFDIEVRTGRLRHRRGDPSRRRL